MELQRSLLTWALLHDTIHVQLTLTSLMRPVAPQCHASIKQTRAAVAWYMHGRLHHACYQAHLTAYMLKCRAAVAVCCTDRPDSARTFMSREDTELRWRKEAKEDLRDSNRPRKLRFLPSPVSSEGSCKRLGSPTLPTLASFGALQVACVSSAS